MSSDNNTANSEYPKTYRGPTKLVWEDGRQVIRPINAEVTMGHDLGISDSYWKPTEREILEDYLKAVQLMEIILFFRRR
jgi:hypothetical protein